MWQKLVWPTAIFATVCVAGYVLLIALGKTVPSQYVALIGAITTLAGTQFPKLFKGSTP